ncbi:uncharacterized protein MKZ38_009535 [Zalerion maritima]|uniref:Aminoglycoside phosphotransferase domain-containing protein n=1 Tax=Zalerion maritima TaxID=339359 RepID=A0AAD5RJZ3_9PEZI|nr:uncharacterized protein MKZ38_009535 [Zalerion maritima]
MPEISCDNDLPELLDTPTKQVKWAKKLVAGHLGSAAKRVDKPPMQGMFSRTLVLTLADGREEVLQFRTEPLDLNNLNVLIDEDCHVTGLVDWELSTPRPFGDAERAFWNELFGGMPADTRGALKKQIVLVQDAVILGTLMDCFFLEDGKVGFSQIALKSLAAQLLRSDFPRVIDAGRRRYGSSALLCQTHCLGAR